VVSGKKSLATTHQQVLNEPFFLDGLGMWILEAILEFLFEIICAATGEAILWAVTLGRRKPFEINRTGNVSTLIGVLFWVLIAVLVALAFLR